MGFLFDYGSYVRLVTLNRLSLWICFFLISSPKGCNPFNALLFVSFFLSLYLISPSYWLKHNKSAFFFFGWDHKSTAFKLCFDKTLWHLSSVLHPKIHFLFSFFLFLFFIETFFRFRIKCERVIIKKKNWKLSFWLKNTKIKKSPEWYILFEVDRILITYYYFPRYLPLAHYFILFLILIFLCRWFDSTAT